MFNVYAHILGASSRDIKNNPTYCGLQDLRCEHDEIVIRCHINLEGIVTLNAVYDILDSGINVGGRYEDISLLPECIANPLHVLCMIDDEHAGAVQGVGFKVDNNTCWVLIKRKDIRELVTR